MSCIGDGSIIQELCPHKGLRTIRLNTDIRIGVRFFASFKLGRCVNLTDGNGHKRGRDALNGPTLSLLDIAGSHSTQQQMFVEDFNER